MLLSRVRHGLWSIRERCSSWPFSSHIPFSINNYLFPFHLENNLNFQRYNFLIGIRDVCRIPRIYLNAKINFITSLRLLFYSESMRESSPYLKYSMAVVIIYSELALCISVFEYSGVANSSVRPDSFYHRVHPPAQRSAVFGHHPPMGRDRLAAVLLHVPHRNGQRKAGPLLRLALLFRREWQYHEYRWGNKTLTIINIKVNS